MKRHKHTNPTDNEDEKTKGKEKRIQRLKIMQGRIVAFLLCPWALRRAEEFFPLAACRSHKIEWVEQQLDPHLGQGLFSVLSCTSHIWSSRSYLHLDLCCRLDSGKVKLQSKLSFLREIGWTLPNHYRKSPSLARSSIWLIFYQVSQNFKLQFL